MTTKRQSYNNKILVLGIDGLDPKLTEKYVAKGVMPNVKKFIERGAAAQNLIMLGAHPTITPPMWTTLATGAYPSTHGITDFWVQNGNEIDSISYGLDSRLCKAEQMWNVTAEAGMKTLVWHWPGSSWPPSSDSPNLHVIDGTQPEGVNCGTGVLEKDFIVLATNTMEGVTYKAKAAAGSHIPCTIDDLEKEEEKASTEKTGESIAVGAKPTSTLIMSPDQGQGTMGKMPYDVVLSQIKPAAGWVDAPEGALEVVVLFSKGMIRRVGLITKNEQGVYDTLSLYKNKKSEEPYAVLPKGEFVKNIKDEVIKNDEKHNGCRNMRVLELAEDGSRLKMWVSEAMNLDEDTLWHPKELQKIVFENCGPALSGCMLGGFDEQLLKECMVPQWGAQGEWVADSLNYLIDNEGYQVVFSHYHNVDLQGHMIVKFMKQKEADYLPEQVYADVMEMVYVQTDEYVGRFMHYLDEGWTIIITSDHAQACPEIGPIAMGEPMGVNVRLMQELGYTVLKTDENGNELAEIDWEKTRAVAVRGNHIYINLKGRNPHGIVDPADQYELEEQIMTDLYGYKHPVTGKRVFAMALRNRDALIMGLSGEGCGDIIYWTSEGYHFDHGDALATTLGYADTSISPIFIAAGNGIKQGFTTDRVIREVDVTPTIAAVLGVRMPAQCEGAPAYQILDGEF